MLCKNLARFLSCAFCATALSCSFAAQITNANVDNYLDGFSDTDVFRVGDTITAGAFTGKNIRKLDLTGEMPTIEKDAFKNCQINELRISPDNLNALGWNYELFNGAEIKKKLVVFGDNNYKTVRDYLKGSRETGIVTLSDKSGDLKHKLSTSNVVVNISGFDYLKTFVVDCDPLSLEIHQSSYNGNAKLVIPFGVMANTKVVAH